MQQADQVATRAVLTGSGQDFTRLLCAMLSSRLLCAMLSTICCSLLDPESCEACSLLLFKVRLLNRLHMCQSSKSGGEWFEVQVHCNKLIHGNDEADVQDFSESTYELADLEPPTDISGDEKLGQDFYQSEFQNMCISKFACHGTSEVDAFRQPWAHNPWTGARHLAYTNGPFDNDGQEGQGGKDKKILRR